jgi:hypothetical protein
VLDADIRSFLDPSLHYTRSVEGWANKST